MNYCKDCKHVVKGLMFFDSSLWKCKTGMISSTLSPVDGKPTPAERALIFCDSKRRYDFDPCGPEGRLWEPKGGGK